MKKTLLALSFFFPTALLAQSNSEVKIKSPTTPLTEPLYVLDGKILSSTSMVKDSTQAIISIASVNPADILTIEVLKGDSAVEKYGDAGKNGVVILTTKGDTRKSKKQ